MIARLIKLNQIQNLKSHNRLRYGKCTIHKNGHNMFEVSSLIQKAIRRSNKDYACYAANELAPRFRKYLWKRLLCVSAEDCYDLVTNKIVALKQADDAQSWQDKSTSIH